jgi:hypothetical protein
MNDQISAFVNAQCIVVAGNKNPSLNPNSKGKLQAPAREQTKVTLLSGAW